MGTLSNLGSLAKIMRLKLILFDTKIIPRASSYSYKEINTGKWIEPDALRSFLPSSTLDLRFCDPHGGPRPFLVAGELLFKGNPLFSFLRAFFIVISQAPSSKMLRNPALASISPMNYKASCPYRFKVHILLL